MTQQTATFALKIGISQPEPGPGRAVSQVYHRPKTTSSPNLKTTIILIRIKWKPNKIIVKEKIHNSNEL